MTTRESLMLVATLVTVITCSGDRGAEKDLTHSDRTPFKTGKCYSDRGLDCLIGTWELVGSKPAPITVGRSNLLHRIDFHTDSTAVVVNPVGDSIRLKFQVQFEKDQVILDLLDPATGEVLYLGLAQFPSVRRLVWKLYPGPGERPTVIPEESIVVTPDTGSIMILGKYVEEGQL